MTARRLMFFAFASFLAAAPSASAMCWPWTAIHIRSARKAISAAQSYWYAAGYSGLPSEEAKSAAYLEAHDRDVVAFSKTLMSESPNMHACLFAFDLLADCGGDRDELVAFRKRLLARFGDPVLHLQAGCDLYERLLSEHLDEAMRKNNFKGVKRPNQPPEPTVMSVTPRADARVAPATTVAHL
jgi:hypothetical protein